jgi:hypothetical protein
MKTNGNLMPGCIPVGRLELSEKGKEKRKRETKWIKGLFMALYF